MPTILWNAVLKAPTEAQRVLGERHAQAQQIIHRRQADDDGKALGEGRARHAGELRRPLHRPDLADVRVQGAQRPGELGIGKAREQAGLGGCVCAGCLADRLDQQHLEQALDHEPLPRTLRRGLVPDQRQDVTQPGAAPAGLGALAMTVRPPPGL